MPAPSDNYGATVYNDNPVGYWRLGEPSGTTATDASTGAHDGTYTNTAGITYGQTGIPGSNGTTAVLLNGTSGYVSLGTVVGNFITTSSFSVECWIKITGNPGALATVVQRQNDGSFDQGWATRIQTDGTLYGERGDGSVAIDKAPLTPPSLLSLNAWHHYVMVYNGTNIQIYLDGATYGAALASSRSVPTQSITASIGFDPAAGGFYFPGTVGEVALYSAALTPTQVTTHYNAGITRSSQAARPNTDVTDGTWLNQAASNVNLFASVDDIDTPNDTDYIQSAANPSGDLVEYAMSATLDPSMDTGHIMRYRIRLDSVVASSGSMSLVTELRSSASAALSTPASFTDALASATEATITQTLSSAQVQAFRAAGGYAGGCRFRHTATQAAATLPTFVGPGTLIATATNAQSFTPTIVNGTIGDLLVLVIIRNDNTAAPTVTGATNVAALTGVSGVTATWGSVAVYTKYATSATGTADQQAITFGSSTVARCGVWLRFGGANGTTPFHLDTKLNTGTPATTINATNLTSTIPNTLGVFIAACIGARSTTNTTTNWTAGAGVTAFASQQTTLGNDLTIGYGAKTFAAAGSYLTPGIIWTTNTTSGDGYGLLLSIQPPTNASKARVTWAELEIPLAKSPYFPWPQMAPLLAM